MSGCLSSMAAIRIFMLQSKPRMFLETMVRSFPGSPLLCFVVLGLLLLFVLFWLNAAPLTGLSPGPVSIRLLPCLGPSLPLTAGLWAVSGSDPGCCVLPGKLTAYGRVWP